MRLARLAAGGGRRVRGEGHGLGQQVLQRWRSGWDGDPFAEDPVGRGEGLAIAACDKLGDARLRQLDEQGMAAAVQGHWARWHPVV
jgi:hypothetical protein